jgi:hypothetical protein
MTTSKCWDCIDDIKKDADSVCGFILTLQRNVDDELKKGIEAEDIAGPLPEEFHKDLVRLQRANDLLADAIMECDRV